jgi:hypothetical protein
MLSTEGSTLWFIPDGYLTSPLENDPIYKNHESVCVMNVTDQDAHLLFDYYFADRDPIENVPVMIPTKRCIHVRMDDPKNTGGKMLPLDTPYGMRIRADVPVVVQYSRLYSTTRNISLMTTIAHPG